MLTKYLSLYVIDCIFDYEARKSLNVHEKMLYINCLSNHFKKTEAYISNLGDFFVDINEMKNYSRYESMFKSLVEAQLIEQTEGGYIFLNKWTKHMVLSHIPKERPQARKTLIEWENVLIASTEYIELVCMKNRISKTEVRDLIRIFFTEQKALSKEYPNEIEVKQHFLNWTPFNIGKNQKKAVVSKAKLFSNE